MIDNYTQHLGVLSVAVHIPASQSLKEKRFVLTSMKDRARKEFNASIAELGGQDKWQVSTLAFAMVSSDGRRLDSCFQNILSFLEGCHGLIVCDHRIEFY